nr:immunoglobulin heavy chain junction region [Mus musculus]
CVRQRYDYDGGAFDYW